MQRSDGRAPDQLRPVTFQRQFTKRAQGSVLASFGETQVLCTAIVQDGVPRFLKGTGKGWITAEYSMLPSSTHERKQRDRGGRVDGRGVEIQRLIGRALRAVVDMKALTERTIWIDCDVIQADGGTRTAAISGAYVALHDALTAMDEKRQLKKWPLTTELGAVSVGVVGKVPMVDLCYQEDSKAESDMNLVMTGSGEFVEIQGAAEAAPFSRDELNQLLDIGQAGIERIFEIQKAALAAPLPA